MTREVGQLTTDLTVILVGAGVSMWIFSKLKLPYLLGFIILGIILYPMMHIVSDFEVIHELGGLGILFMMFFVGMEFNLTKLKKVLFPATTAIVMQTLTMMSIGIVATILNGGTLLAGVFLGGIMSVSSTIVLMDIFEKKNRLNRNYAQLAIGVLILEDLLAILMLVLLSGVAMTGNIELGSLWNTSFMLITFMVAIFILGKIFLPPMLKKIGLTSNSQIIMIFTLAFVFLLGEGAKLMQFSVALGAFLAGSILAGTGIAKQIEQIVVPFRNFFVAIFFVSIGMEIDPSVMMEKWEAIIFLSGCVLVGQSVSFFAGAVIGGETPRTAWLAGINKARIGEFSFVIAALGNKLKVIDEGVTAIAMGVAFVTIFVNPFISERAEVIGDIFEKLVGDRTKRFFSYYRKSLLNVKGALARNRAWRFLKKPVLQTAIYFLIGNVFIVIGNVLSGMSFSSDDDLRDYFHMWIWIACGIGLMPLVIAIMRNINAMVIVIGDMSVKYGPLKGKLLNGVHTAISVVISLFFLLSYTMMAKDYLPRGIFLVIFAITVTVIGVVQWRQFIRINSKLEYAFMQNFSLHLRNDESMKRENLMRDIKEKYPWPIEIDPVKISYGCVAAGKSLRELQIRKHSGATIVAIEREGCSVFDISADTHIFPNDVVILIGEIGQVKEAENMLLRPDENFVQGEREEANFAIEYVIVGRAEDLLGKTLQGLNLSKRHGIMVVGIQRGEEKIISPNAGEKILENDILLVVGKVEDVESFRELVEK